MAAPQLTGDHPLRVEIVTRSSVAWEGRADEVQAPGFFGEFGALPEHARLLSATVPGIVTVHVGGEARRFVVGPGFAEVGPDRVTLLVDSCEDAAEVDKAAAAAELERAEAAFAEAAPDTPERDLAERDVLMARARLEA